MGDDTVSPSSMFLVCLRSVYMLGDQLTASHVILRDVPGQVNCPLWPEMCEFMVCIRQDNEVSPLGRGQANCKMIISRCVQFWYRASYLMQSVWCPHDIRLAESSVEIGSYSPGLCSFIFFNFKLTCCFLP